MANTTSIMVLLILIAASVYMFFYNENDDKESGNDAPNGDQDTDCKMKDAWDVSNCVGSDMVYQTPRVAAKSGDGKSCAQVATELGVSYTIMDDFMKVVPDHPDCANRDCAYDAAAIKWETTCSNYENLSRGLLCDPKASTSAVESVQHSNKLFPVVTPTGTGKTCEQAASEILDGDPSLSFKRMNTAPYDDSVIFVRNCEYSNPCASDSADVNTCLNARYSEWNMDAFVSGSSTVNRDNNPGYATDGFKCERLSEAWGGWDAGSCVLKKMDTGDMRESCSSTWGYIVPKEELADECSPGACNGQDFDGFDCNMWTPNLDIHWDGTPTCECTQNLDNPLGVLTQTFNTQGSNCNIHALSHHVKPLGEYHTSISQSSKGGGRHDMRVVGSDMCECSLDDVYKHLLGVSHGPNDGPLFSHLLKQRAYSTDTTSMVEGRLQASTHSYVPLYADMDTYDGNAAIGDTVELANRPDIVMIRSRSCSDSDVILKGLQVTTEREQDGIHGDVWILVPRYDGHMLVSYHHGTCLSSDFALVDCKHTEDLTDAQKEAQIWYLDGSTGGLYVKAGVPPGFPVQPSFESGDYSLLGWQEGSGELTFRPRDLRCDREGEGGTFYVDVVNKRYLGRTNLQNLSSVVGYWSESSRHRETKADTHMSFTKDDCLFGAPGQRGRHNAYTGGYTHLFPHGCITDADGQLLYFNEAHTTNSDGEILTCKEFHNTQELTHLISDPVHNEYKIHSCRGGDPEANELGFVAPSGTVSDTCGDVCNPNDGFGVFLTQEECQAHPHFKGAISTTALSSGCVDQSNGAKMDIRWNTDTHSEYTCTDGADCQDYALSYTTKSVPSYGYSHSKSKPQVGSLCKYFKCREGEECPTTCSYKLTDPGEVCAPHQAIDTVAECGEARLEWTRMNKAWDNTDAWYTTPEDVNHDSYFPATLGFYGLNSEFNTDGLVHNTWDGGSNTENNADQKEHPYGCNMLHNNLTYTWNELSGPTVSCAYECGDYAPTGDTWPSEVCSPPLPTSADPSACGACVQHNCEANQWCSRQCTSLDPTISNSASVRIQSPQTFFNRYSKFKRSVGGNRQLCRRVPRGTEEPQPHVVSKRFRIVKRAKDSEGIEREYCLKHTEPSGGFGTMIEVAEEQGIPYHIPIRWGDCLLDGVDGKKHHDYATEWTARNAHGHAPHHIEPEFADTGVTRYIDQQDGEWMRITPGSNLNYCMDWDGSDLEVRPCDRQNINQFFHFTRPESLKTNIIPAGSDGCTPLVQNGSEEYKWWTKGAHYNDTDNCPALNLTWVDPKNVYTAPSGTAYVNAENIVDNYVEDTTYEVGMRVLNFDTHTDVEVQRVGVDCGTANEYTYPPGFEEWAGTPEGLEWLSLNGTRMGLESPLLPIEQHRLNRQCPWYLRLNQLAADENPIMWMMTTPHPETPLRPAYEGGWDPSADGPLACPGSKVCR